MSLDDNFIKQIEDVRKHKTRILIDLAFAFRSIKKSHNYYKLGQNIGNLLARFVP